MSKIDPINYYTKSYNKPAIGVLDWVSKNDLRYYKDYLSDGQYEIINKSLRNGSRVDFFIKGIIEGIDRIFDSIPKGYLTKRNEVVYRGINTNNLPKELEEIITLKGKTNIFVDKAFTSTSEKKEIAKQFKGQNGILLKINLPPGAKRLKATDFSHLFKSEEEITLPRNSEFRVESYDERSRTAVLTYLGQKKPIPEVEELSKVEIELENISDYKKNILKNNKFKNNMDFKFSN